MHAFNTVRFKCCFLFGCILLIFSLPSLSAAQVSNISRPVGSVNRETNPYTIHSNFAKNGNCFDLQEGWLVGQGQYIAMPFTPKADAKATDIVMGLLHCEFGCGPNVATISLNEDSGGLPGTAIHTWVLHNIEGSPWPSCTYKMTVANSKNGVTLKKGEQYWLVAEAPATTTLSWAYTYKQLRGDFAYEKDGGGWLPNNDFLSSFAIFGKKLSF